MLFCNYDDPVASPWQALEVKKQVQCLLNAAKINFTEETNHDQQ